MKTDFYKLGVDIFNQNDPAKSVTGLNHGQLETSLVAIINIIIYLAGIAAIIIIIIGGFKYVLSQGNDSAVASAKNTILYAVIGLIITILAYAFVHWLVVTRF